MKSLKMLKERRVNNHEGRKKKKKQRKSANVHLTLWTTPAVCLSDMHVLLTVCCERYNNIYMYINEYCIHFRVRKQVVNIPSYIVRLDSQKHIDFSLNSPYGGGRPGRCFFINAQTKVSAQQRRFEPHHEKTCLRVLRPGKTKTVLRSH